jgi:hypothetical protein
MLNQTKSLVRAFALGCTLLAAAQIAHAEQTTIAPGDSAVDGSIIQAYHNSWRLMGRGHDGSVIQMGVWSDDARVDTIDGREVILRRQIWIHDQGSEGYFNVLDHHTLAPVLSQYTNAAGIYRRLEYSADGRSVRYQESPQPPGEGVRGPFRLSAPMQQGVIATAAPAFDFNTGTFGLMIAGFPLREGYSARFPVFRSYEPSPEPAWVDFEVTGRETISLSGGRTFNTWRVVVHSPDTEETMIFNLVKEAPYVIRLQQEWNGRDWTFEMM